MAITIKQGLSGQYFSANMPDVEISITGKSLAVKMAVSTDGENWEEIFSETLFPMETLITLRDLGELLKPYARQRLSMQLRITMTEDETTASQTLKCQVVYCEADLPTTCADWISNRFLTILDGIKRTAIGRLEYLHYIGTEAATATALYSDGTTKQFDVTAVGGNGNYTTIDVSPSNFITEGKTLAEYSVTAGNRRQQYRMDFDKPDCAPILIFTNSFGVEELFYCTGTHTKAPTFKRESAYINGKNKNYNIIETRTFKADTGILNEAEAFWFGEVLRSDYVRIVTFRNGHPNIGKEIVLTDSKSEQNNNPDELIRFTFSYQYAQKNQNVVDEQREGRIFDNTFDYTFN